MAENNPLNLPGGSVSEYMPTELNDQFFEVLDQRLQRNEALGTERLLGEQERRGFLQSGDTQRRLVEEILGPSQQRRQEALLPLAMQGAGQHREERLGELNFQRQRQMQQEDFQRQLQLLDKQAAIKRDLLELESSLSDTGFGFGDILGQVVGVATGGSVGGFVASLGKQGGQTLGGKLFGSATK